MSVATLSGQSITIYPQGEPDKYNKTTYGTGVVHSCRFTKTSKTIVTPQNEREPIDGIAIIDGNPTVNIGDRVLYGSDNYRVMSKKEAIGGSGSVHHVTLQVQKWNT